MWIARCKSCKLEFTENYPNYNEIYDYWYNDEGAYMVLNSKLFSEVTFENSPKQVELKLID